MPCIRELTRNAKKEDVSYSVGELIRASQWIAFSYSTLPSGERHARFPLFPRSARFHFCNLCTQQMTWIYKKSQRVSCRHFILSNGCCLLVDGSTVQTHSYLFINTRKPSTRNRIYDFKASHVLRTGGHRISHAWKKDVEYWELHSRHQVDILHPC